MLQIDECIREFEMRIYAIFRVSEECQRIVIPHSVGQESSPAQNLISRVKSFGLWLGPAVTSQSPFPRALRSRRAGVPRPESRLITPQFRPYIRIQRRRAGLALLRPTY
jgi:hypothetical protein